MADPISDSTPDRAKWLARLRKRKQRAVPERESEQERHVCILLCKSEFLLLSFAMIVQSTVSW